MIKLHTKRLLALAGLAVILASISGGKAIPIYDGVGFPDEPYRYVKPPVSQKQATAAPTQALATVNASEIINNVNGVYVTSSESGPKVAITLGQNSLIMPRNAKTINIQAAPLAPPAQPSDGTVAGNFYKLTITSDAGPVKFAPPSSSNYKYIDMRLPQGYPANPVMEYMDSSGSWHKLDTSRVGNDIYEAQLNDFGDYALVIPKQASSRVQHQRSTKIAFATAGLIFIAILTAIIFFIRSAGSKKAKK